MKNYTHTLNEGFTSFFKKLEESMAGDASKVEISGGDGKNVFYFYVGPSYKHNSVENIIAFAQENLDSCRDKSPEEIEAGHMFWGTDSAQFEGFYNGDTFILFDDINKLSPDIKQDALRYCKKPLAEAASKKASTDHKWGDKSVKSQLALPENQAKLNSFLKPGRDWREMRKEFVDLINSLDCTDKNKKQTIMKINGVRNEGAFYSTVATYLTGIKTESVKLQEEAADSAFHVIVEYKDGVYEDTINRDFWFNVLQPALEKDDSVIHYTAEKASMVESLHESKEIPVKDLFLEYEAGGNIRKVKDCYVMTDSDTIEDRSQSPARKISISKTGKSRTDTVQGEKTFSLKTAEGKGRVRIDVAALKDAYERASSKQ